MPLTHTKDLFAKALKGKYTPTAIASMRDFEKDFDSPNSNRRLDGKKSRSKNAGKSNRGKIDDSQASVIARINSSCNAVGAIHPEALPRTPELGEVGDSPFGVTQTIDDGCIDEHSMNMFVTNNIALLEIPHQTIVSHLEICRSCRSRASDLRSLFAQFVGNAKLCSRKATLLTENCTSQSA